MMCHRGAYAGAIASAMPEATADRARHVSWNDNEEVPNHQVAGVKKRIGARRESTCADIALPICLVLLVSVPVMMVEESWYGRPMIEEGSYLWILPAFLVASAFLFGGALAGFRCPASAVAHASAVASISLAVLLLGAVISQGLDCSRRDAECRPLPLGPRRDWCPHTERDRIVVWSSAGDAPGD